MSSPPRRASPSRAWSAVDPNTNEFPRRSNKSGEGADVIARTLGNENDLLRFQLSDIIAREKNQRLELQRLRAFRDVEVASLVKAATQQLKDEVEQMKSLLHSTSCQLHQAVAEKEKVVADSQQALVKLEELKYNAEVAQSSMASRLQGQDDTCMKTSGTLTALADAVERFQRHVLPTFKPLVPDNLKPTHTVSAELGPNQVMMNELARLQTGLQLLRVIVDAKNDTLVLIRGKLKQENEELRAELQVTRQKQAELTSIAQQHPNPPSTANDDIAYEKTMLRQELHLLQDLFNAEVKQLKEKLKKYEAEEVANQTQFIEIQKECATLRTNLMSLQSSRTMLEASLKDETSARSQLVSQLFNLRKENERMKTELETLKLNQKFLVRQPRGGRIAAEKMDLMNTVNQLLVEMNKLKEEKVALEEEVKVQRHSQVHDYVTHTVTARDIALVASNKVGDGELAGKLANTRLKQLAQGNLMFPVPSQLGMSKSPKYSTTMNNLHLLGDRMVMNNDLQESESHVETPIRDDFNRNQYSQQGPKLSMHRIGSGGLVQLAGERFLS
ncbi:unnamed protein product [Sphagnum troendelagicum]|uniref:Uncharacterized protein n=1 Tax=Sphagnum troendelagicum TaxID=128251 RepID=A0ABP0UYX4_9BRYO